MNTSTLVLDTASPTSGCSCCCPCLSSKTLPWLAVGWPADMSTEPLDNMLGQPHTLQLLVLQSTSDQAEHYSVNELLATPCWSYQCVCKLAHSGNLFQQTRVLNGHISLSLIYEYDLNSGYQDNPQAKLFGLSPSSKCKMKSVRGNVLSTRKLFENSSNITFIRSQV